MFDIRKIQEQVIFEAVRAESDAATASHIVGGGEEEDAVWVKNTMKRLQTCFDQPVLRRIRKNCQCGYGMEERLNLLRDLMSQSSTLEEFGSHEKALASGMSFRDGELYLEFPFLSLSDGGHRGQAGNRYLVSLYDRLQQAPL